MIRYQITDGTIPVSPLADLIQVRNAALGTRQLSNLVRQLMDGNRRILVNDRLDVALATGAAGVHLKSDSVRPELIRRLTPLDFLITVACHSEEDVHNAQGADYAILSPIFSPLSKADTRHPLGIKKLRSIAKNSRIPILALGGITDVNAPPCVQAGAEGVAGISLFRRTEHLEILDAP